MRSLQRTLRPAAVALGAIVLACTAAADIGPIPMSLKGVSPPVVPGLFDGPAPIVVDRQAALVLGKALFWDVNVGSDGMACASCHFHAGADRRVRNQLAPGGRHGNGRQFEIGSDGLPRGINQTLRLSDFPFNQPLKPFSEVDAGGFARQSDDVVGSAGSFGGRYRAVDPQKGHRDSCLRQPDALYRIGAVGARRVIERNAPTVINAVFNHRQLWDGRASTVFNGSSSGGPRDPNAGVWTLKPDGRLVRERLALVHSSLASQAMTAPLSEVEMSCQGRTLADIGRKLLPRRPLDSQKVHPEDSVLGPMSASAATGRMQDGLVPDYLTLVRQAFHPRFWSATGRGPFGQPARRVPGPAGEPYNQAEANFSLFFGLALQVYQSTLVSDDSPFDRSARDAQGLPIELTPAAQRGLRQFRIAHCAMCHIGPAFTAAAVDTNAALTASHPSAFGGAGFRNATSSSVVQRMAGTKGFGFIDTGFAATGVGQDHWDPGLAGKDEWGHDIALAAQYLQRLAGRPQAVIDPRVAAVRACDLPNAIALNQARANPHYFTAADGIQPQAEPTDHCLNPAFAFVPTPAAAAAELADPATRRMLLLTDAAFKIPTLRNVELTGPYMHNGSMATLEHVIEFYARGGNFTGASKQFGTVFGQPNLQLDASARADLIEFLHSLTDERVRYERAPFDHPELVVPHGHEGDRTQLVGPGASGASLGKDLRLVAPAVGASGRRAPLQPFHGFLDP